MHVRTNSAETSGNACLSLCTEYAGVLPDAYMLLRPKICAMDLPERER